MQLDDWVLCRIYNKKGTIEKQQAASRKPVLSAITEEKKPDILATSGNMCVPPAPPFTENVFTDHVFFDTSDSVPRLHTDSSCSEQVVSPEFTCDREVQSEPKWREWEKVLDPSFNFADPTVDSAFATQFPTVNQMTPLQDMFMYLPKPY